MDTDSSSSGEGPTILQLLKWNPSELKLDLSEFREGFLSPMRDLLVLLSYENEGLMIPLDKGETCHQETSECGSSLGTHLPELAVPITEQFEESVPSTSKTMEVNSSADDSSHEHVPISHGTAYISDVNSLAWGICEDASNHHEERLFRELLFMTGNRGVTVHAFRDYSKSMGPLEVHDTGEGRWMEWGPSAAKSRNFEAGENGLHDEASENVNNSSDKTERVKSFLGESGKDEPSKPSPRRYWRTFLTKVRTLKNDHDVYTKFPQRSSLPPNAKVASFTIFERDSLPLDFLFSATPVSHIKEENNVTITDNSSRTISNESLQSTFDEKGSAYKCFKVFTSDSHDLIGFALAAVKTKSDDCNELSEKNCNDTFIAVARLRSWGIHWVCSVELNKNLDASSEVEWTDFRFVDDFLICLGASGIISFYVALTGEFLAYMDVWLTCGLGQSVNSYNQEHSAIKDFHLSQEFDGRSAKRRFKKLLNVPNSLVLGVIDEHGSTYIISGNFHRQGKHDSGILNVWGAGATDVSCQRVLHDSSNSKDHLSLKKNSILNKRSMVCNDIQQNYMAESSRKKCIGSGSPLRRLRNVILPARRSSEYDVVSASPFGITCLNRQFSVQGERKCQLVHSGYFINLSEDNRSRKDPSGWEALYCDAVGCSFQGFLYLVAEDGFLVVLPSVSVSPVFFPVEAIGYRQIVSRYQLYKDYEFKNWRRPWSPPKVEILDRVLISEGPEEADVVCMENGWDLKISRIRRLQLALHYLKFEEVEKSLEMLALVDLAEEGILRLLFAAVYLILQKNGNDNEVSAALRLLGLATAFSTRTIRLYGMLHQKRDDLEDKDVKGITGFSFLSQQVHSDHEKERSSKRLCEMARFLEIIRNLQLRLTARFKRPGDGQGEVTRAIALVDDGSSEYDPKLHLSSADALSAGAPLNVLESGRDASITEKLALMPVSVDPKLLMDSKNSDETSLVLSEASSAVKRIFPLENPKDMIARWEFDKLDLTTIVKDALLLGRLPLAVLKLHLHRSRDLIRDTESQDLFNEVRDVGRSIAYGLFLKVD